MKVFISWSGTTSHQVAKILRDWLPSVIQSIEPYVSSEDIDKGTRWSTDIASELHASSYGLVCVTSDNVKAPWINFEAGALGKSIDKSRVSPFLFRIKRSEVEGPLLQFQSTVFEKADVLKLLKSMNIASEQEALEEIRLEKTFEVWWPELEKLLNGIAETAPEEKKSGNREESKNLKDLNSRVLEELLDLTRKNHKILRDPASLFPQHYIDNATSRALTVSSDGFVRGYENKIDPDAVRELIMRYQEVQKYISDIRVTLVDNPDCIKLFNLIDRLDPAADYINRKLRPKNSRLPIKVDSEF